MYSFHIVPVHTNKYDFIFFRIITIEMLHHQILDLFFFIVIALT